MIYNATVYHLLALLCTLLVEGAGIALWARFAYPNPTRAILCALAINLIVHTLFWYSQPLFARAWPLGLYAAEIVVALTEGFLYARLLHLSAFAPYVLSAILNLASLCVGLWLWQTLA